EKVLEEIKVRDDMDSKRKDSPLIIPENAIVIDTTHLTEEEVVKKVFEEIKKIVRGEI
ncbi:MAG: (d)CMP kinase, partial [Caldanaerobacter sp.]